MPGVDEARRVTINELDKAYNDTRYLVDDLVKKSRSGNSITLVQLKLDKMKIYIDTLKTLGTAQVRGGRKTRRNRRK